MFFCDSCVCSWFIASCSLDVANADYYKSKVSLAFTDCLRVGVVRTLSPIAACDVLSAADKEALKAMCPALYKPASAAPPPVSASAASGSGVCAESKLWGAVSVCGHWV